MNKQYSKRGFPHLTVAILLALLPNYGMLCPNWSSFWKDHAPVSGLSLGYILPVMVLWYDLDLTVSWNFSQLVWVEKPNGLLALSPLKNLISLSKHRGSEDSALNLEGLYTHSTYFFFYSSSISYYLFDSPSSPASMNSLPWTFVYVNGF